MSYFIKVQIDEDPVQYETSSGYTTPQSSIRKFPLSQISVLVVGAGPAGLYTALECWRKGHHVRILERAPEASTEGDFFAIGPSVIRRLQEAWPGMAEENEESAYNPWIAFHKWTGEVIKPPHPFDFGNTKSGADGGEPGPARLYRHNRPKMMKMLMRQLCHCGVNIEFGHKVVEYFESEEGQKAGVVTENGDVFEADVVVAADGVGTKSHNLISGRDVRAWPSGYSIYRTAFPVERAMAVPELAERFKVLDGHPIFEVWLGPDMHATVFRTPDIISWLITHKDTGTSKETWSDRIPAAKVKEYTACIPGWPGYMDKLIDTTPEDGIIDWKIMWRDPQQVWTSPLGRVVQIGDAAHTFTPMSGNGATQGMEDGISLATCLELGGKDNVHWATRVHTKLRFERVSCCQKLGVINQNLVHGHTGALAASNSKDRRPEVGRWVWAHNPEKYVYDKYDKALAHLREGIPFKNTNIPTGYVYEPWTIPGLTGMMEKGEEINFGGDWS